VLAVIGDGLSIRQVAEKWGVSRQTLHSRLARYDKSRRKAADASRSVTATLKRS